MSKISVHNWTSAPGPLTAVSREGIPGDGASLTRVDIPAGTVTQRHQHSFEQFVFVIEGGGRLFYEEGSCVLSPGTILHIPAECWHSADFDSDTLLIECNIGA